MLFGEMADSRAGQEIGKLGLTFQDIGKPPKASVGCQRPQESIEQTVPA